MHEMGTRDPAESVKTLDLDIDPELASVARQLVSSKYWLDKTIAEQDAAMLSGGLHDGGYGPAQGWPFLQRVLPFLHASTAQGDPFPALVPTAHVLGCSWKWRGRELTPHGVTRRVQLLSDVDALLSGELDQTRYCWIQPLGIIAPHEGKNRADFFRAQGIEFIPANVVAYSYPAEHRLKVYRVEYPGFAQTWAVLDDRWLQRLDHPNWSLPVLEAYGVEVRAWPSDFARPQDVQLALFERPGGASFALGDSSRDANATVDLHTIAAKQAYADEHLRTGMSELKDVKVDARFWQACAASAVLSMLALAFAPQAWGAFREAAATAFGLSLGAVVFPFLGRVLVAPRRALTNQRTLPPDRHPERVAGRSRYTYRKPLAAHSELSIETKKQV
ncbi:UNVERIFIED_ORG: hypothetical protein J2W38_007050 [Variovorax paradoxus]|nr:hypothetical protein [Variovorax paradoxus]